MIIVSYLNSVHVDDWKADWSFIASNVNSVYVDGWKANWSFIASNVAFFIPINCHNVKELYCSQKYWCVPFIGDLSESCTSGLIAGSHDSEEHAWGEPP